MAARIVLIRQAAEKTGLSYWELYNGAKSGKYPAMRIGGKNGRWAFDLDLLEARITILMEQNIKADVPETLHCNGLRRIQA